VLHQFAWPPLEDPCRTILIIHLPASVGIFFSFWIGPTGPRRGSESIHTWTPHVFKCRSASLTITSLLVDVNIDRNSIDRGPADKSRRPIIGPNRQTDFHTTIPCGMGSSSM